MNRKTFLDSVYQVKDSVKYIILDDVKMVPNQHIRYSGKMVGDNPLRDLTYIRFLGEVIPDLKRIMPNALMNFDVNEKGWICPNVGVEIYENTFTNVDYAVYNTESESELNLFDFLSRLLKEDDVFVLVRDGIKVDLKKLEYAHDKCSIFVRFRDERGDWKTKRLFWFTDKFNRVDFSVVSKKDCSKLIDSYVNSGLVVKDTVEMSDGLYNKYEVISTSILPVPVDFNYIEKIFSRELLLTIVSETDAYNAFIEGVNLTEKVFKRIFECSEKQNYSHSEKIDTEIIINNFKMFVMRPKYDRSDYVDRLLARSGKFVSQMENMEVDECKATYKELLDGLLFGDNSQIAKDGAREVLNNVAYFNYLEVQKLANKIKKDYSDKIVLNNLYCMMWRSIFIGYPNIIHKYLNIEPGIVFLHGGVFNSKINLQY